MVEDFKLSDQRLCVGKTFRAALEWTLRGSGQAAEGGCPQMSILANEVRLAGGDPDLVCDDRHHEYEVEAESPED